VGIPEESDEGDIWTQEGGSVRWLDLHLLLQSFRLTVKREIWCNVRLNKGNRPSYRFWTVRKTSQ